MCDIFLHALLQGSMDIPEYLPTHYRPTLGNTRYFLSVSKGRNYYNYNLTLLLALTKVPKWFEKSLGLYLLRAKLELRILAFPADAYNIWHVSEKDGTLNSNYVFQIS